MISSSLCSCLVVGESPSITSFNNMGVFRCRSGTVLKNLLPDNLAYEFVNVVSKPVKPSWIMQNYDLVYADFVPVLSQLLRGKTHLILVGEVARNFVSKFFATSFERYVPARVDSLRIIAVHHPSYTRFASRMYLRDVMKERLQYFADGV